MPRRSAQGGRVPAIRKATGDVLVDAVRATVLARTVSIANRERTIAASTWAPMPPCKAPVSRY
jgi:hypothetical protein